MGVVVVGRVLGRVVVVASAFSRGLTLEEFNVGVYYDYGNVEMSRKGNVRYINFHQLKKKKEKQKQGLIIQQFIRGFKVDIA